jgi:hypothetical protein
LTTKKDYINWLDDQTVSAEQLNEQIRDNGNALWPYTQKGDIAVAITEDELINFPSGSPYQIITSASSTQSGLAWTGFLAGVQNGGGWLTSGSINSFPTNVIFQAGMTTLSFSSSASATVNVTFPIPFSTYPMVFATPIDPYVVITNVLTLCPYNFTGGISMSIGGRATGNITVNYKVAWLAIGPVG